MIALSLKNISKTFDSDRNASPVLKDINLDIRDGEFFVIVGPSGSGKSTLLRIASGLEKSYKGSCQFGQGLSYNDISFVFQQFAILPWLTVAENVGLGLMARHIPKSEQKNRIKEELKNLKLEKFADAYPKELSGGMRQRVGIARALVTKPKIIFMDEAFSELDSFTAEELRKELLAVWLDKKPTIVMVTHLISEAIELGDRIAVMTSRPGQISAVIKNHLPRPREKRAQDFYNMEDEIYKLIKP